MTLIFISYSRKDLAFAEQLEFQLRRWGYRPWRDVTDLSKGVPWDEGVEQALDACHLVIGIVSPDSVESDNVRDEWAWALDHQKPLVLVRIKPAQLPMRYGRINLIDFGENHPNGFTELHSELVKRFPLTHSPSLPDAVSNRDRKLPYWIAALGASLITALLTTVFFTVTVPCCSPPSPSNLSSYLSLDLVDDDQAGSDFAWVAGNNDQVDQPALASVEVGNIRGTFVSYPVQLRSVRDDEGDYSNGIRVARAERELRNVERRAWDTLLATLYIKTGGEDQKTNVSVIPYLEVPERGTVYLGFGQVVPTDEWTLLVWREVIDSNDYSDAFFNELMALRGRYDIPDDGFIRLTHIYTGEKPEGTRIGFSFRLLSDLGAGEEDSLNADIYISSVTFLPQDGG